MGLQVLLAGGNELQGNELEATVLEAGDDGTNKSTLAVMISFYSSIDNLTKFLFLNQTQWKAFRTWTPSGLMAMKLD